MRLAAWMALAALPALAAPHTITVPDRGSTRRESTPGSPVIRQAGTLRCL